MQDEQKPIVLASTSPRRRELVMQLGLDFKLVAVDIDETPLPDESPDAMVERLSHSKVKSGARTVPNSIVVAADTVVALDETILGKPRDSQDAERMLRLLRGRAHVVYTGLAVRENERHVQQIATTTVWMRNYSDAEIAAYVATGDPLDKAAAYAIQHATFHPVERIEGCHANVMGLPLCRLYLGLKEFGVAAKDPERFLTSPLEINCPVSKEIRRQL